MLSNAIRNSVRLPSRQNPIISNLNSRNSHLRTVAKTIHTLDCKVSGYYYQTTAQFVHLYDKAITPLNAATTLLLAYWAHSSIIDTESVHDDSEYYYWCISAGASVAVAYFTWNSPDRLRLQNFATSLENRAQHCATALVFEDQIDNFETCVHIFTKMLVDNIIFESFCIDLQEIYALQEHGNNTTHRKNLSGLELSLSTNLSERRRKRLNDHSAQQSTKDPVDRKEIDSLPNKPEKKASLLINTIIQEIKRELEDIRELTKSSQKTNQQEMFNLFIRSVKNDNTCNELHKKFNHIITAKKTRIIPIACSAILRYLSEISIENPEHLSEKFHKRLTKIQTRVNNKPTPSKKTEKKPITFKKNGISSKTSTTGTEASKKPDSHDNSTINDNITAARPRQKPDKKEKITQEQKDLIKKFIENVQEFKGRNQVNRLEKRNALRATKNIITGDPDLKAYLIRIQGDEILEKAEQLTSGILAPP